MNRDKIKSITRNLEAGGWMDDLPNLPGVAVKVRGIFNSDYTRRYGEVREGLTPEQLADAKLMKDLDAELILDTILLDWSGMDEPFTRDAAKELLTNPEFEVFLRGVNWAANVVASRGRETLEASVKN